MKSVDLIIQARWIVPIEPRGLVHENYAIVVHEGRILDILKSSETQTKYTATIQHSFPDHVLIPGLINAHTHMAMSLMRGIADDIPLMEWLQDHIWPTEQKWISAEFVRDGTEAAMAELLRGGVTCFNDMYFFPEEVAHSASRIGMRACIGLIMIDFPSAWANNAMEYLHKGLELHDQFRNHPLVTPVFSPHAPYTVSDEPLQRIAMYADELDLQIHIHVHETAAEIEQSINVHKKRPLQRLNELGLVSPRLIAVHMTQVNDDEINTLAQANAHIVHCPESNLKLASGFCPVQSLINAGINVCIGTDGAASNNDLNMFGEMRTSALLAKAVAQDARATPAFDTLRMATLNAAKALGLDRTIGSLEIGKAADLVAVHLGDLESQPVYNPISQLVYATSREKVTDVWVAGKHLLKDRILTTMDEQEIVSKVTTWGQKLRN